MKIENELGYIEISEKAIADIAGYAAMTCYGVVGMAHQRGKDGLIEILSGKQVSKGVKVRFNDKGEAIIDVFVILEQAIKISVVAENIIDAVKYNVEKQTGIKVRRISINVVSIRM
ncbi:MAG: Asp23/Gls24 family envelope stress response protein [Eubacteriaceae bacterium]|jgi:uncharacterized alkaline shock family protein YloU